jgi:hypothetical protein
VQFRMLWYRQFKLRINTEYSLSKQYQCLARDMVPEWAKLLFLSLQSRMKLFNPILEPSVRHFTPE